MKPVGSRIFGGEGFSYRTERQIQGRSLGSRSNIGPYQSDGYRLGEYPTDLFDAGNYEACLHSVVLGLSLIGDAQRTQTEIEDDGIIHELIHLLHIGRQMGITVDWLNMAQLRNEIHQLQVDALGAYERINAEVNAAPPPVTSYRSFIFEPLTVIDFQAIDRELKKLKEALEQQDAAEVQKASAESVGSDWIYPVQSLHQSVLQRIRNEEAGSSSVNIEAGRSIDLRDGESGQVSMQSMQETGPKV